MSSSSSPTNNVIYKENELLRIRTDLLEHYDLAEKALTIRAPFTVDISRQVGGTAVSQRKITKSLTDLIDFSNTVLDEIQSMTKFHYQVSANTTEQFDHSDEFPKTFSLLDVNVSDFFVTRHRSTKQKALAFGATLVWPNIKHTSTSLDTYLRDGQLRKIFDWNRPHEMLGGERHQIVQTLNGYCSSTKQEACLLSYDSITNVPVTFPEKTEADITAGSTERFFDDESNSLKGTAADMGIPLHAHLITDDKLFPKDQAKLRAYKETASNGRFIANQHVVLPIDSYTAAYFTEGESACQVVDYDNEDKHLPVKDRKIHHVVELPEYAAATYNLRDKMYYSRITDFDHTYISWFLEDYLPETPVTSLRGRIQLRLIPVVPKQTEDRELIPYHNFMTHVERVITNKT